MILIIGGLGFVGSNTAQALLDVGEDCILTRHQNGRVPAFLSDHIGKRIIIESLDISSGYPTANQGIVNAIRKVIPNFDVELPAGHMPGGNEALWYFDIAKLRMDTGFEPQFDVEAGIADYIAWLRAGNER